MERSDEIADNSVEASAQEGNSDVSWDRGYTMVSDSCFGALSTSEGRIIGRSRLEALLTNSVGEESGDGTVFDTGHSSEYPAASSESGLTK